jgi:hypothetical protein
VAKTMVIGHTREVRLEIGLLTPRLCFIRGTEKMCQVQTETSINIFKKYADLSLRSQITNDINPIDKIFVSGTDPRLCSTTFYQ